MAVQKQSALAEFGICKETRGGIRSQANTTNKLVSVEKNCVCNRSWRLLKTPIQQFGNQGGIGSQAEPQAGVRCKNWCLQQSSLPQCEARQYLRHCTTIFTKLTTIASSPIPVSCGCPWEPYQAIIIIGSKFFAPPTLHASLTTQ